MSEENIKQEEIKTSAPEESAGKNKAGHGFFQKIKQGKVKKIIAIILLAVFCFCGGLLTDRYVLRRGMGRNFNGRPNFQGRMRGNFNNNGNNNFNNGNGNQSQDQNQSQSNQ